MRNILTYLFYLALPALLLAGCNKPRNIPEKKLERIVHDVLVANAYADMNASLFANDTLDMYTPVLAKYGYRPADMKYTIQNFAKLKSSRFADVIDAAMRRIESESSFYAARVAMRDSIDGILAEKYRREVYRRDSLVAYTTPSDLEAPDITLDVTPGRYKIEFRYFVDTAFQRPTLQYRHFLRNDRGVRSAYYTRTYRRGEWVGEDQEVTVNPDVGIETFNMIFASATLRPEERSPRFRVEIDSLVVWHYLSKEAARDSFIREILPRPAFDDQTTPYDGPEIIIPLRPDTTGTATGNDD